LRGEKNRRRNKEDRLSRIEKLLEHLIERQKKTDEQIRETDRRIRQLGEETDRKIRQLGEETDRKIRQLGEETDRKIMKLGEELRKRIGDLTDAQGLFWESASENGIKKFLEDRGYQIKRISRHVEAKTLKGEEGEFDIIFEAQKNGEGEIFIVEVKSTAHAGYINEFIEKLRSIFDFFPEFRGKNIWGVFSSGRYGDGTERYAIKSGLITFGISGDVVTLLNPQNQIKPFFTN